MYLHNEVATKVQSFPNIMGKLSYTIKLGERVEKKGCLGPGGGGGYNGDRCGVVEIVHEKPY